MKKYSTQTLLIICTFFTLNPAHAMAPGNNRALTIQELQERKKDRLYTIVETDRNVESCQKFCCTCASMTAPLISLPLIPLQEFLQTDALSFHKAFVLVCALSLGALGNICQDMCSDCAKNAQERESAFNNQLHQFATMSAVKWHELHRKWEQGSWDSAYGRRPSNTYEIQQEDAAIPPEDAVIML